MTKDTQDGNGDIVRLRRTLLPRNTKRKAQLRISPTPKIGRYLHTIATQTAFLQLIVLLILLWLLFSAGLYFAERGIEGTTIDSYGKALYWGIAALSTAGIADTPLSGTSRFIGGSWIIIGSVLFFGTIVATVTRYFMRPVQHPADQIVDAIEYNLEHLGDLSVDELDLLKETTDGLIVHVERLKAQQAENTE